jgi:hypothetical protein
LGVKDGQWTQTLKFTEPTGNEQSGHTEGLKNFKDYLQKSAKIPQQLSKSKSRKFGKVVDLIFQTSVGRPRNAEIDIR